MQQSPESTECQRDARMIGAQAADDGGAPSDGDDHHAMRPRDVQDAHDLVVTAGAHDKIRHVIDGPGSASGVVNERRPARRGQSIRARIAHVVVTYRRLEGCRD